MPEPPRTRAAITPTRVVIGICLALPFAALLWVDSYAETDPTLIGVPFFYWYQMLWVLISAGLTSLAYLLLKRERRSEQRSGGEQQ